MNLKDENIKEIKFKNNYNAYIDKNKDNIQSNVSSNVSSNIPSEEKINEINLQESIKQNIEESNNLEQVEIPNEELNESDKENNNKEIQKSDDIQSDAQGDAQSDAQSDAQGDAQSDAQSDVISDVISDAISDAQSDAQNDAISDAISDVISDAQSNNTSIENLLENSENTNISNESKREVIDLNNENSNENIDNIIFSNNEENKEENIEKFFENQQNVTVNIEVAVKDNEIIYKDDIIYLQELENQLLSTYPVTKQGIKYIQEIVKEEAIKIIEIKNIGQNIYKMQQNGIKYPLTKEVLSNIYTPKTSKWIIPIVYDKHKIYTKLKENDDGENINEQEISNIYFSESLENREGIIEKNQKIQMSELKKLGHEVVLNKLNFKNYLNKVYDITCPYIPKIDNQSVSNGNYKQKNGFLINPVLNTLVLRYYDMNTIQWNTRLTNNDYKINYDTRDENDKIIGTHENLFIKGDEINILGFLILPESNIEEEVSLSKYFEKVGTIQKIFQSGKFIHIELPNHNLKDGDIIYIEDSNSFPHINNTYSKSLSIINNDIISIESKKEIVIDGNYGILYALKRLKYDLYNVVETSLSDISSKSNKSSIKLLFESSNYDDKKENSNHNKVYLFDKIKITNKKQYDEIVKSILPTTETIVNNLMKKLQKYYTLHDMNNLLKLYNINIDDIHITQNSEIKEILKKNLIKFENEKPVNVKLSFNKNQSKFFLSNDFFLSNYFIKNSAIENIYGSYKYLNAPEDNIMLRLKWIESQKDYGNLYYQEILLQKLKNDKNIGQKDIVKFIKNKIKTMNDLLAELEKNFEKEIKTSAGPRRAYLDTDRLDLSKERMIPRVTTKATTKETTKNEKLKCSSYKYQPYVVTEKDVKDKFDNMKSKLENETTVFYENNIFWLKDKKMIPMENIEDNSYALINNEIWEYKDGLWTKTEIIPLYDNIKYLCELDNVNLNKIELDTLDCVYRKEYGCNSKLYTRYQEKINELKINIEKFTKLENYINNEQKIINDNINKIINKYFFVGKHIDKIIKQEKKDKGKKQDKENNKKDNSQNEYKPEKNIIPKTKVDKYVDLIYNIKNDYVKLNLIYDLIDKDGILIGKDIYSKKYGNKINICGHYNYFKKIDYSDNPDEKTRLYQELLGIYSDNGAAEKNVNRCINCGQTLIHTDYDETEGFGDNGMIKKSRMDWIFENVTKETSEKDLMYFFSTSTKSIDCNDKIFKEILLKYGLSIDDIDDSISICNFITKNLYVKVGVTLPNDLLITVIIDSMQKIKNIIPFNIYREKGIKTYIDKGWSKIDIDKINAKNIFIDGYKRLRTIKKYTYITSRFLIAVQTIIPPLIKTSKSAICPFNSFDGEEGINFMACILENMELIMMKDKSKLFQIFKDAISESYNEFKDIVHIKELFKNKKVYDANIAKKKINISTELELQKINNEEQIQKIYPELKSEKEFHKLIHNSKNYKELHKLYNDFMNRLKYLAYQIKHTVKTVIETQPLNDYTLLENSCCTEYADSYINYYFFIESYSSIPLRKIINESIDIYKYRKYFIKSGLIHRFILYDKNKFDGIYNNPIVDDDIHTSESIIKGMFENFVDTGFYAGTRREYVNTINDFIDIKSGLTKKEILSKTYSIADYQKLLKDIEKNNIKYYNPSKHFSFSNDVLNDMKKTSEDKLDASIINLVKNISQILNKDKDFIEKYTDLLRNCGTCFNTEKALNSLQNNTLISNLSNERFTIKQRELSNKNKLDYLKKFYVTKMKKYLSTIKNCYDDDDTEKKSLDFIGKTKDDEAIKLELQNSIYTEHQKIMPFLNKEIQKYFLDLDLTYNNQEINSIIGKDNLYNFNFEKVIVYSNFTFFDASNVLLYIIISNLNDWILKYGKESSINIKSKYISEFILFLLDSIEEDDNIFILCKDATQKFRNSMIHDIINKKAKDIILISEDDDDYLIKNMKNKISKTSNFANELEEFLDLEQQDVQKKIDNDNKIEFILEKGKKELTAELGIEPTNEQLENYKNNYLESMQEQEDSYENNELNDLLMGGPRGADVLDQGAGYGELNEYDFEDGNGFDYAPEE